MLTVIWRAIQSTGVTPSANAVIACVRRHNIAFRDADAKRLFRTLSSVPGTDEAVPGTDQTVPAPQIPHVGTAPPVPGTDEAVPGTDQTVPRAGARITKELFKRDTATDTSLDLFPDSLRSSGSGSLRSPQRDKGDEEKKTTGKPKLENAKSKQQQEALPWVTDLRAATAAIAAVPLRNLTLEERLVCGRYHAFRFENCTRSESTNRKAGAKAAAAFAKMADSKIFSGFTVRDYIDHAAVYQRDFMGGAPFYDPFLIRAVLDAQPIAAGGAR